MKKLIASLQQQKQFPLKSQGSSMLPILRPDDIVYFKKVYFKNLRTNDLILVKKNHQLFTHRIIYKADKHLVSKGDNNLQSDGKIYPRQIIAKVYQVRRDGQIFDPENLYLLQSTLYFQEIVKIKKVFEKEKIDFVLLKGLPLHLYYEKKHPQRFYLDCDVLINKNDFKQAENNLLNCNYKKFNSSLSSSQKKLKDKEIECSYIKTIDGLSVVFDLHLEAVFMMTQLGKLDALYSQNLIDELTHEFLKEKQKIIIQDSSFYVLSSIHLIVYLALHFFHHNFHGAFRLELLDKIIKRSHAELDSASRFRNKFGITGWEKISKTIRNYQLANFVYPVFVLLKKDYKTPIPQSFLKQIQPSIFQHQNLSSTFYPLSSILKTNIFNDESRVKAGISRFKNLFFLSPNPVWRKLFVFINPQVIFMILWIFWKRLKLFFSFLNHQ